MIYLILIIGGVAVLIAVIVVAYVVCKKSKLSELLRKIKCIKWINGLMSIEGINWELYFINLDSFIFLNN